MEHALYGTSMEYALCGTCLVWNMPCIEHALCVVSAIVSMLNALVSQLREKEKEKESS